MLPVPWNSLEVAKIAVGILTPLSVAILGWFLNARIKRLDLIQWNNQKLIEKRLAVYDQVAPLLNTLFCFFMWVGYWKDISPASAIQAKRDLDKSMNIYRHLFDRSVYDAYQAFIHILFETFTGPGHDAKLRTFVVSPDGNRQTDTNYVWDEKWSSRFSTPDKMASKKDIVQSYDALMAQLRRALGVDQRAA